MKRLIAAILSLAMIQGCASPRLQAPASLDGVTTKSLKLALVVTEATKASVKTDYEAVAKMQRDGMAVPLNKPFDAVTESLRAAFESVTVVESVEEARRSGADLVAILDENVVVHSQSIAEVILTGLLIFGLFIPGIRVHMDLNLNMVTLGQTPIDDIKAEQSATMWSPDSTIYLKCAEALGVDVRNAVATSAPLASFARERLKSRPAPTLVVASDTVPTAPAVIPPSDVYTPAYSFNENPNAYAIVIGIEKYASIPDARFAERDAAAVREHLLALGYPPRNVIYLTGESASRAGIQKYVEDWLPRNVNEESRVFVYFSGHGAPDPETKQAYLVPWDGDPKFLKNTGYPISRLNQNLGGLKAKEIVLAMDSCFSGEGGRSVIAQGTRPMITRVDTGLSPAGNLVSLTASAADEITGAEERQGQGLFTYNLLKALNQSKGEASVAQLYAALLPLVRDAARRENRDQTPQMIPGAQDLRVAFKLH
jgi:hypothetical protein